MVLGDGFPWFFAVFPFDLLILAIGGYWYAVATRVIGHHFSVGGYQFGLDGAALSVGIDEDLMRRSPGLANKTALLAISIK